MIKILKKVLKHWVEVARVLLFIKLAPCYPAFGANKSSFKGNILQFFFLSQVPLGIIYDGKLSKRPVQT